MSGSQIDIVLEVYLTYLITVSVFQIMMSCLQSITLLYVSIAGIPSVIVSYDPVLGIYCYRYKCTLPKV